MIEQVYARADDFDLIHFHIDYLHFPISRGARRAAPDHAARPARRARAGAALPHVLRHAAGVDLRCAATAAPVRALAGDRAPRPAARPLPLPRAAPARTWRSSAASRARSASTARSRSRGALGMPLKIAAKVDQAERDYLEEIRPLLDDPLVEFVGEIGEAQKDAFPRRRRGAAVPDRLARALRPGHGRGDGVRHAGGRLSPGRRCPRWCATASPASSSTIIDEAVQATEQAILLSRRRVPRGLRARFTCRRMARDYLDIYARADRRQRARRRGSRRVIHRRRRRREGAGSTVDGRRARQAPGQLLHPRDVDARG